MEHLVHFLKILFAFALIVGLSLTGMQFATGGVL
jgi:hypothetical protein